MSAWDAATYDRARLGLEAEERFAPYLRTLPSPWNFDSVGDTEVDALLRSMPRPLSLHYVRLNISAGRSG